MCEYYFRSDLTLESPVKKVYSDIGGSKFYAKQTCHKCGGSGYLVHFGNCDEGRCWTCRTRGYNTLRVYSAKEMQSVIRATQKKSLARIAKAQLESEIWSIQRMGCKHKSYLSNVAYKTKKIKSRYQSQFFGNVGDRVERALTLDWCVEKEGDFGVYYVKQLSDNEGNIFSHMGSAIRDANNCYKMQKGSTFTLKFTIKGHGEYKGLRQTKIKNPKLVKGEV
jgi:hypothetical protein